MLVWQGFAWRRRLKIGPSTKLMASNKRPHCALRAMSYIGGCPSSGLAVCGSFSNRHYTVLVAWDVHMYLCVFVMLYVYVYVYVSMQACITQACMYSRYAYTDSRTHARTHACRYGCMHVCPICGCLDVWMHGCMYVCMYMRVPYIRIPIYLCGMDL